MKSFFPLAFAGLIALIISLAQACIADDTAKLKIWKPDPNIVAGLGQEIVIDGSAFRIPQTVSLTESRTDKNTRILKWRGSPEDNGIRPFFMVIEQPLDSLSDEERKDPQLTSTAFIRLFHHLIINIISEPDTSDIQHGSIAGQEFSREYFKGYNHRWLREIHGFSYAAITKRAIFIFHVWDQEPLSKYSLPVSEVAVQTFHQTDQPNTAFPDNLIDPDDQQEQQNQDQSGD
jgi:hypothetical protein